MGYGPFDLTAGPFLSLYAAAMLLAIIVSFAASRWLRPEGRYGRVQGQDQLAYLAGGTTRVAEAAATQLLASGAMTITDKTRLRIRDQTAETTRAGRCLLAVSSPVSWKEALRAVSDHAGAIDAELVRKGLLLDGGERWRLRLLQSLPLFFAAVFGWIKIEVGTGRDKPVEFITALVVVTMIIALVRLLVLDKRTKCGIAAIEDARLGSERPRRAPMKEETGMTVALYGTTVLVGSALSDFHELRRKSGEGNSGDGGSSDGGCGGGGCGGCGGCGG